MVVAEVPLWVIHSNEEKKKGPADGGAIYSKTEQSLSLLLQNSNTSSSSKKCAAIYSVDVHPDGDKFATAGGDGTVRLWNAASLFQPPAPTAHFDEETGAFVSSGTSSSSDDDSARGSGSSSSEEENKTNGNKGKNKEKELSSSTSSSSSEVEVHDLNAVARRKKDGSAAAPSSPPPKHYSTASSSAMLSPSRGSPRGHHHHHHQHRLLCTLSAHTGSSVLSVRFSTTGQYLASAGDDACVCIYAPSRSSSATGNLVSSEKTVEHWSRIKLCRGHGLDVVDLAWAPDDSHLVSCSLDSATPIIVWKLPSTDMMMTSKSGMICNPFRVLGQGVHTSTVKGVTFDPAGSYIASSGDDPAVCVWRAHDDWGLEARVDADTGIFRKWAGGDDAEALSTQSLFRRISWSTDGAFVCSTNSVVRNKHVASTIAREGWSVSGQQQSAAGAANLVGHKQPVVVSRHARQLLKVTKKKRRGSDDKNSPDEDESEDEDENEDDEPEYATLLALGDRRGFVTVWSTRKPRPIFKLQCSESRCTVTDLSWGLIGNKDLMLLVSLLDGQLLALRFSVPDELGPLLSKKETARVFQLRYGIDMDDGNDVLGQRRLFVGGNSGPKLIENALQMTLEEDQRMEESDVERKSDDIDSPAPVNNLMPRSVRDQQQESRTQGKKRVRPVLMQVDDEGGEKRPKVSTPTGGTAGQAQKQVASTDPLQNAMDAADRASAVAESGAASRRDSAKDSAEQRDDVVGIAASPPRTPHHRNTQVLVSEAAPLASKIPHSTDRTHSVDLPLPKDYVQDPLQDGNDNPVFAAECTNVMKVPTGSKGSSIQCIDLVLSKNGKATWKDQIPGTSCSALAASLYLLAIGTSDGTIQFFSCSPALGWACGSGFRSHPPLIFGQPIVSLQLKETNAEENAVISKLEMVVVTADGSFGVYTVLPELALQYQGSIMPAMTHMSLGLPSSSERRLPSLWRIQITDVGRLFLLLSFKSNRHPHNDRSSAGTVATGDGGAGGSVQAFVFEKMAKLWLRVSDSRFVLSDFYNALPSSKNRSSEGILSRMDDAVRLGSLQSSLKASHRGRLGDRQADSIYDQAEEDSGNYTASRSHCEDRMACALAMNSSSEFKHWLSLYVRALCMGGRTSQIRMLVDMLLSGRMRKVSGAEVNEGYQACWWLSNAPVVLKLGRKSLVESIILPEMSKNRSMQRLTNEIALDIDNF